MSASLVRDRPSFVAPAGFALGYFGSALAALFVAAQNNGITVAWPASGIYVAAMLLLGGRQDRLMMIAGVVVASVASNLLGGTSLPTTLAFTVANAIDGPLVVALMGGDKARGRSLSQPLNLLWLAGAAAVGASITSLTAGVLAGTFEQSFLFSWASTVALGIIIVTPVILYFHEDARGRRKLASRTGLGIMLLTMAVSFLAYDQTAFPLLFLPVITLSLATLLLGVSGTAAALLVVAAMGSVFLVGSDRLLVRFLPDIPGQVLFFQLYLVTLLVSALPVAFLIQERHEAMGALRLARERAEEEAARALLLANTDALTGISSRRQILLEVEHAIAAAQANGSCLTVALIDVDHFKRINDTHGHDMGDRVLRGLATMMSGSLRDGEKVGRIGGEEFLTILPGSPTATIAQRCQQLREQLAKVSWPSGGPDQVTLSIGIAEWREGWGEAELLRSADIALYQAKAKGRDRCVVAETSTAA